MLENHAFTIESPRNQLITMEVIPGHFTTGNSHLNYYLNMSRMKASSLVARDVARELASSYLAEDLVDTIICMEDTEVIGAYMAEEFLENSPIAVTNDREIHVIRPTVSVNGQLIFMQSNQKFIYNKHIVLLISSASSGKTILKSLECMKYYGGILEGISAIFSARSQIAGYEINTIFSTEDLPDYMVSSPGECRMCSENQKIDAIVGHDGYTII
jgi:orotate phosphoribosyltransferase